MLNFMRKYGALLTAFAVMVSTHSVNTTCCIYYNQPKQPESVKKLRNF